MEEGTPPRASPTTPQKVTDAIPEPPISPSKKPNDASPDSPISSRRYRLMYEKMRERFNDLQKCCDNQTLAHNQSIEEKENMIAALKTQLEQGLSKNNAVVPLVMKMNNTDMFVSKPRKGAKDVPTNKCAISTCDNINVDLIKCCMCANLVCEDCSKVKIAKLRPLMNQCETLYFTCHICALHLRDDNDINMIDTLQERNKALTEQLNSEEEENDRLTKQVKTMEDQQKSLQTLLEERENTLQETTTKLVTFEQSESSAKHPPTGETAIEELITKRFDKIDQNIDALITKKLAGILPTTSTPAGGENSRKLFSTVVGTTGSAENHISTIKTTRNAEIIEKQEQEKRANNIIIYGVSEERPDANVTIKEHDLQFINDLFEAIEVNVVPKQAVRLGNEVNGQNRPIKVVLNSPEDKEQIMSSLKKLKNAEAPLRRISVRDDYTIEERQLIKSMQEEAKRRNTADNVTHWKVRGTPKNGLKVVKITARN